jgi:CheY-like chemotaxis protein
MEDTALNYRDHDTTCGVADADRGELSRLSGVVCAALGQRVRGLRIEIREGGLVLRGLADSDHAKRLAQYAVMTVTGLPLVANRIEIAWLRRGPSRSDGVESGGWAAGPLGRRVLLATGDDRLRSAGRDHLTEQGCVVATAADGVECAARLREFAPDVVILDTDLLWGGADGVLAHLRAGGDTRVPVVLLASPFVAWCESEQDVLPPVVGVLEKPVAVGSLLRAVRSAVAEGTAAATGPDA